VHGYGPANRVPIEPADIAILAMKAHQPVDRRYLGECSIDRPMRLQSRKPFDAHSHERAQPGLRALNDRIV
jgi:hypothetical protein